MNREILSASDIRIMKELFEERVKELALMLSGDTISLYALDHARSLLENK